MLVAGMLFTGFCSAQGAENVNHVTVYYFHGNSRCPTCYKIEAYTKEAVENFFAGDLAAGKLVFKPVNIDKKKNRHFASDYSLYTRSVVLSLVKNGKEVKHKNLADIWNLIGNKEHFIKYVKSEVEKYLALMQ